MRASSCLVLLQSYIGHISQRHGVYLDIKKACYIHTLHLWWNLMCLYVGVKLWLWSTITFCGVQKTCYNIHTCVIHMCVNSTSYLFHLICSLQLRFYHRVCICYFYLLGCLLLITCADFVI